jgi:hypothetical protein
VIKPQLRSIFDTALCAVRSNGCNQWRRAFCIPFGQCGITHFRSPLFNDAGGEEHHGRCCTKSAPSHYPIQKSGHQTDSTYPSNSASFLPNDQLKRPRLACKSHRLPAGCTITNTAAAKICAQGTDRARVDEAVRGVTTADAKALRAVPPQSQARNLAVKDFICAEKGHDTGSMAFAETRFDSGATGRQARLQGPQV